MGIIVAAFGGIENLNLSEEKINLILNDCDSEFKEFEDLRIFYINTDFKERAEDISSGSAYSFEIVYEFSGGTSKSHNAWKETLLKIAKKHEKNAFQELIDFADNEGIIGTKVSKKLFNDFVKFEKIYKQEVDNNKFLSFYDYWKEAFEIAAENGCIEIR